MKDITFQAIFNQAKTTPDGGWRITLDLSAEEAHKVTQLAVMKDVLLQVAVIPISTNG